MIKSIDCNTFLLKINPFVEYQTDINLYTEKKVWGDTVPYTMALLSALSKDRTVFEFGTFRGLTTYNLANTADEVYTLDLGENTSGEGYPEYVVGEVYKRNNSKNVTQLLGNSIDYDFSKLHNKFDIVWLDGGHSYESCIKDFETSLKLVKQNTTTIIAIDDYPAWEGVKQAIEEIAETKHLYYIPEIALIIYINNPQ